MSNFYIIKKLYYLLLDLRQNYFGGTRRHEKLSLFFKGNFI